MSEWLETEIKLGLPDQAAWNWVRSQLRERQVLRQANHFFDDSTRRFSAGRIGVRIRSQGADWTLAVKTDPSDQSGAITRRLELESPLPAAVAEAAIASSLDLAPFVEAWRSQFDASGSPELSAFLERLATLSDAPLAPFGHFENERTTGLLDLQGQAEPIAVELDRTRFSPTRTDYELEVELRGSAEMVAEVHAALVAWLGDEGGIHSFSASSKLARFEALNAPA